MENKGEGIMPVIAGFLQVTKANATAAATELHARIADGRMELLDTYERLAFLSEVFGQFNTDTCKTALRAAIDEQGGGTGKVATQGGVFSLRETGTKYDYATDAHWSNLDAIIAVLTEKRKARETFLKSLASTVTEAYQRPHLQPDGSITIGAAEQIMTRPPDKSSTEGVAFTMFKG